MQLASSAELSTRLYLAANALWPYQRFVTCVPLHTTVGDLSRSSGSSATVVRVPHIPSDWRTVRPYMATFAAFYKLYTPQELKEEPGYSPRTMRAHMLVLTISTSLHNGETTLRPVRTAFWLRQPNARPSASGGMVKYCEYGECRDGALFVVAWCGPRQEPQFKSCPFQHYHHILQL